MGLWKWTKTAAGRIGNGIGSAASGAWNGIGIAGEAVLDFYDDPTGTSKRAATAIGNGAAATGEAIGKLSDKAYDGVLWVQDNPDKIVEGLESAGQATWNFTKYTATHPIRSYTMTQQGIWRAGASTVGMVGDAGRFAIRKTYNLGYETEQVARVDSEGNFERDKNGNIKYDTVSVGGWNRPRDENGNLGSFKSIGDGWADAVTLVKPGEKMFPWDKDLPPEAKRYEQVMLYGSQAVGEVGAFVGVTMLTAGTGSAAFAGARATAYGLRFGRAVGVAEKVPLVGRLTEAFSRGAGLGYKFSSPVISRAERAAHLTEKATKLTASAEKLGEGVAKAERLGAKADRLVAQADKVLKPGIFNRTPYMVTTVQGTAESAGALGAFGGRFGGEVLKDHMEAKAESAAVDAQKAHTSEVDSTTAEGLLDLDQSLEGLDMGAPASEPVRTQPIELKREFFMASYDPYSYGQDLYSNNGFNSTLSSIYARGGGGMLSDPFALAGSDTPQPTENKEKTPVFSSIFSPFKPDQ